MADKVGTGETRMGESTTCPTCGRDGFDSRSAMKIHHGKVHDESIAGVPVDCDWCGKETRQVKARIEEAEHHFCSEECYTQWKNENYAEMKSDQRVERIEHTCLFCGEEFFRTPGQTRGEPCKYCSHECRGKAQWDNWDYDKEDHPSWKGGRLTYYGKNWTEQREKALQRDGFKCQSCGDHRDERVLQVHHIIPAKRFDVLEDANYLGNLVTLCVPCHHRWVGVPVRPTLTS